MPKEKISSARLLTLIKDLEDTVSNLAPFFGETYPYKPFQTWYPMSDHDDEPTTSAEKNYLTKKKILESFSKPSTKFIMETIHEDDNYFFYMRKQDKYNKLKNHAACYVVLEQTIAEYFNIFKIQQYKNSIKELNIKNSDMFNVCNGCPFSCLKEKERYNSKNTSMETDLEPECNGGIESHNKLLNIRPLNIFTKKKDFENFYKIYKIIIDAHEQGVYYQ